VPDALPEDSKHLGADLVASGDLPHGGLAASRYSANQGAGMLRTHEATPDRLTGQ